MGEEGREGRGEELGRRGGWSKGRRRGEEERYGGEEEGVRGV